MTKEYLYNRIRMKAPKAILQLIEALLLLIETLQYWLKLCKYNASFNTDNDKYKMQYTLLRENHVIEKGMSMNKSRKGFGQQKVMALLQRLAKYYGLYGDNGTSFLRYPLSTIQSYILFQNQEGINVSSIESLFNELCIKVGFTQSDLKSPAGITLQHADNILNEATGDFSSLLYSRHSIRYFTDELPTRQQLNKALELAARTPSACNRQTWHTHIYMGEQCHELLRTQGGCNGFYDGIHCCIVVTADMKGFLDYEPFQCYIDGGLYAMNLINALHYIGLGSIPLSCGFYNWKLKKIQRKYQIPENEAMIVIVGVGQITDDVKIAESTRRDIGLTNMYH